MTSGYRAGERRLALLLERGEALAVVVGVAERGLGAVLGVERLPEPEPLVAQRARSSALLARNAWVAPDAAARAASLVAATTSSAGNTRENRPDRDRLVAAHEPPGVDQVERLVRAEPLEEERVPARVEGRAELRERRADLGGVGDVDDVGRDEQAESDAQARAVRDGEGRRREGAPSASAAA